MRWSQQWVRGMVGYDAGECGGRRLRSAAREDKSYIGLRIYMRAYSLESPGQLHEGCARQQGLGSLTLRVLFCGNDCYFFFLSDARDSLSSLCRTAIAPFRYAIYIDAEYTISYTWTNPVTIHFHPTPLHYYTYTDILTPIATSIRSLFKSCSIYAPPFPFRRIAKSVPHCELCSKAFYWNNICPSYVHKPPPPPQHTLWPWTSYVRSFFSLK